MSNLEGIHGRRVLVTGANSGIGFITALELARSGGDVIMVCRDETRGHAALEMIRKHVPGAQIQLMLCDLSEQSSIREFSRHFYSNFGHLDVLVNNAGAYLAEFGVTTDGLERTFALNHMGYFLMTQALLQALRRGTDPRIINVSSEGHRLGRLDFDDLQWTRRRYRPVRAYCDSKLMNILFTRHLARRLQQENITVNALHPGTIRSGFAVSQPGAFGALVRLGHLFLSSPEKGARTSLFLASDPSVAETSGQYFVRCRVARPSGAARNEAHAERLWALSSALVRHPFDQ